MEKPGPQLPKLLRWVASAKKDLTAMPRPVQRKVGFALYLAQVGEKHPTIKPYTVRLKRAVYVLHCFKKKSTKGAQTPRPDMELIRARLKAAEEMDKER